MLGDVVGDFGLGHDRELPFFADQLLPEVGPIREHELHDVARRQERRVGNLVRRHDRDAMRIDVFSVEGIEPEFAGRRGDVNVM